MGKYETSISKIKDKIVQEIKPEKIILFGSYAWGEPTEDSDVDLFIIQKSKEPRRIRQKELRRKLWGSDVPMDLLVYTPEEIEKRLEIDDPFILHILNKGKVLYSSKRDMDEKEKALKRFAEWEKYEQIILIALA
jgi:predicted nucleotidyltransferase